MTESMPRTLPQYAYREKTRHKRWAYYFRRGKGKRTRLPDYGTPGFQEAYDDALQALEPTNAKSSPSGTLAWLIERYRETAAFRDLSLATRRQRENIFKAIIQSAGGRRLSSITRTKIEQGRDDRLATPAQARHFLDTMRGLFRWAKKARHVSVDPTADVDNPKLRKTEGFKAWTEEDVRAYEAHWPAGSKERVWLHVLLYTGLRRGDAVRLGRQHIRDGVATLRTEKNGVEVNIPILDMLSETLAIGPTGDLAFIVGDKGQPLTKESFGNMFGRACRDAGLRGKTAHGVRKIGATRAAEAGASVSELEALFGWTGGKMASHYTRTADRKRLAKQASDKIKNSLSPHLRGKRPAPKKKVL